MDLDSFPPHRLQEDLPTGIEAQAEGRRRLLKNLRDALQQAGAAGEMDKAQRLARRIQEIEDPSRSLEKAA